MRWIDTLFLLVIACACILCPFVVIAALDLSAVFTPLEEVIVVLTLFTVTWRAGMQIIWSVVTR
jgi:hypothetical protein